jgi:DNA-directed RNA polymerase specialized sigma24 family protein
VPKDVQIDPAAVRMREATRAYESARAERDRTIVRMAKVDGLSMVEISRRIDLSPPQVGTILRKSC